MKRMTLIQKLVALIGAVVLLIGGYGSYYSYSCSKQVKAKKQFEVEVKNNLPVGSQSNEVLKYLVQKKIEHFSYLPKQRTIIAIQRKTLTSLFVTEDVQITFAFDQSNKLVSIQFNDLYTGL